MNIANVCDRFAVLAGSDSETMLQWSPLAEDACAFVQARCIVSAPDSEQTRRLEMLAAAYMLRLYSLCGGSQLSQFVAGDVRLTSSADTAQRAAQLWQELAADNTDLVKSDGFIFGRVM